MSIEIGMIHFGVIDVKGNGVEGTLITLEGPTSGSKLSDEWGFITFNVTGFGIYSWNVSKKGYKDISGTVELTDDDRMPWTQVTLLKPIPLLIIAGVVGFVIYLLS